MAFSLSHNGRRGAQLPPQDERSRAARIVGEDALPPRQQLTLLSAELVNEAFLRQSAFSDVDRYCSAARQTAMLELIVRFVMQAEAAVARGVAPQAIGELEILRKLKRMGEEIGEDRIAEFSTLQNEMESALAGLKGEAHAS